MAADHLTPDPVEPVTETTIPGLVLVKVAVRQDNRGWCKENWRRGKLAADAPTT